MKNGWFRSSTVPLPRAWFALAIAMALPLSAQIQQAWTRSFAGTFSGYIGGFSVAALDGQSNLCLTGTAGEDFLTVKYSPDGSLIWSNRFDGGSAETAQAVAADAQGQVWVSGISWFTNGSVQSAAMVIKYDAGGSLAWTQRVHTNVISAALAVDASGNSYVAGALLGGLLYVVKYSSGGTELWARNYLSTPGWFMSFGAVAINGAGNVVLAGLGTDLDTFSRRSVLVKFDAAGSLTWSNETLPYVGGGAPSAMTVDQGGSIYVSGNSLLAAKVGSNGLLDWTRPRSGSSPTFSTVQTDPAGNLVVAGTDPFYQPLCSDCGESETVYHLFRTRLSPSGAILWPERSYRDFGFGYMQFDADGSCYLGGSFSSDSDDPLPPHPDSILVKYAPNGSELWRTNFSTGFLAGIRVDGAGDIYLINGISGPVVIRKYVQPETAPAIRSQPLSRAILDGDDVSFSVSGSGFPSPVFRWRFNKVDLPNETNDALLLPAAHLNQAGAYSVVLSNSLGSITSALATLTVNLAAPTVAPYFTQGTNSVLAGSPVTMCAGATGGPKPSLQWRFNGTDLPGQTNACLSLGSVRLTNAGCYEIIASNHLGVTTGAATLTVIPLSIAFNGGHPTASVVVGSCVAIFSSILLNSESYALQWQHDGLALNGETNRALFRCVSNTNQAGEYALVLLDDSGSHTSAPVMLTVFYQPPQFSSFYFSGGGANPLLSNDFTVCASFTGSPARYQWRFNGGNILGQTNDCLTLFQISSNMAGAYSIVASNAAGVATSTVQTVTVSSQGPQFVEHPLSTFVVEGGSVAFQATALAGPPAVHVLQFNGINTGVPYVGARFGLFDVTPADAGEYRVVASNMFGMATSSVATLTVTPSGPLDRWTARNPLPQSQQINAVCHSTNQFVAVGERGTIMTSPDGTNWTVQSRRVDSSLNGVACGGGVFVAVGNTGMLLSSEDGTNWAYRYSGGFTRWEAVTYGDGRFVAVGSDFGNSTVVGTSTDGIDWTSSGVPGVLAQKSVAFGQGVFIAAGDSAIIQSLNGTSWTLATNPAVEIETLFFANGAFIAAGDDGTILVSSNGIAWSARTPSTSRRLQAVTYGAGRWMAAGARGTMLTSSDTIVWSAAASGTPDRIETIDFHNGLFVALGENGTTLTSTDGMSWTKQNFGTTRDLDGLAVANGIAVIVGKAGTILTSRDGTHYTPRNAGVTNDLHGIGWGNGLWVAVGEPGVILTSTNAIDWESRVTGSASSLKSAAWGHAGWVIVGTQGTILTSANGIAWQSTTSNPAYDLNDVASGMGAYVIAGDGPNNRNGSAFISSNAAAWSVIDSFVGKNLRSVTFTDGRFTFAANDGLIYALTNTVIAHASFFGGFFGGGNLRDLIRLDGMWTIVGNNGVIGTTTHGLTNGAVWASRASRTFENLHQIAYLDGKLVAIGNRGTILQSGRFVAKMEPPVISGGLAQVPFNGVLNQDYQFEASTNLTVWTPLMSFTNTVDRMILQDPGAVGNARRFYRVTRP